MRFWKGYTLLSMLQMHSIHSDSSKEMSQHQIIINATWKPWLYPARCLYICEGWGGRTAMKRYSWNNWRYANITCGCYWCLIQCLYSACASILLSYPHSLLAAKGSWLSLLSFRLIPQGALWKNHITPPPTGFSAHILQSLASSYG